MVFTLFDAQVNYEHVLSILFLRIKTFLLFE
jgi:hypothetical protein